VAHYSFGTVLTKQMGNFLETGRARHTVPEKGEDENGERKSGAGEGSQNSGSTDVPLLGGGGVVRKKRERPIGPEMQIFVKNFKISVGGGGV